VLATRWLPHVALVVAARHDRPMIDPSLFVAFAAAVTLLMLFPGPNVSLLVANSIAYGPKYGFLTLAGTVSAMVVQLCLTAFGMTEILSTMGLWFGWLRWIGVVYLIYLGVAVAGTRRRPDQDPPAAEVGPSDLLAGAAGIADQPEDAVVLWRVFPAVRLDGPSGWTAACRPVGHLLLDRDRCRRRLGPGCRTCSGFAGIARIAAQQAVRRLPGRRRRGPGIRSEQVGSGNPGPRSCRRIVIARHVHGGCPFGVHGRRLACGAGSATQRRGRRERRVP
jgi:hypothetical protein